MTPKLVIFVEGGQVQRVLSDTAADTECFVVYADVSSQDKGQLWVRDICWPSSGEHKKVLVAGINVEVSPDDVGAVVRASGAAREGMMGLLQGAAHDAKDADAGHE